MGSDRYIITIDKDLEDLIPGFIENRLKDIDSIRSALEKGDMETVRIIGHTMKGSGGGYGFDRITEIGGSIEEAAKAADKEKALQQTFELAKYLSRIDIIYE